MNQLPNILTIGRIILVVPFALALLREHYEYALLLFFIAGLSDGVDGFLARQFKWRSRFGEIADPLADKLLLVTSYAMLAWTDQIPVWLVALVFGRDVMIVVGALIFHYKVHHYDVQPSLLGKLSTFLQIAYVLVLLVGLAGYPMDSSILLLGLYSVALVTFASGAHYLIIWGGRARSAIKDGGSES
jgi:cardiolipin synthase